MKIRIGLVVASFILSVLIGLSISREYAANGNGGENDNDGLVIGLSMDTLKEARWQVDRDVFLQTAESLGATVLVQSANSDDTRQMRDVQSLISNNVDALVIVPHNGAAMAKGPHADTFKLLVGDGEKIAISSIADELSKVGQAQDFMSNYRERLRATELSEFN